MTVTSNGRNRKGGNWEKGKGGVCIAGLGFQVSFFSFLFLFFSHSCIVVLLLLLFDMGFF